MCANSFIRIVMIVSMAWTTRKQSTKSNVQLKTVQQQQLITNLWYEDIKQNANMLQVMS